jgi:hypothetical protein
MTTKTIIEVTGMHIGENRDLRVTTRLRATK